MKIYRITLRPLTAFGSALAGDTLFGQLCWTLRHLRGEEALTGLLDGYTDGRPFAVLSDAFPQGFVPLPHLPVAFWQAENDEDRKKAKAKRWLAVDGLNGDLAAWRKRAVEDKDAFRLAGDGADAPSRAPRETQQPHNTINRSTGTTGEGAFAPYTMPQRWYSPDKPLDCYAVLDEARLPLAAFTEALDALGKTGYGRDASIGLGKFERVGEPDVPAWQSRAAKSWLALAPLAPQNLGFDAGASFYQVKTHFGRHGDTVATGENPFKRPLLTARTGAVFSLPEAAETLFLGRGIGGVSIADARAVHQGYAPVMPLPDMPKPQEGLQ